MCELLVGLPGVNLLGIEERPGALLRIHIETRAWRVGCVECGVVAQVKDRPIVELVDLAAFGRPSRLVWHKVRWCCPEPTCPIGSWTEENPAIGAARMAMSDRSGRWVTEQVGRHAHSVNEVVTELGCDWHTINDTVLAYGTALVEDLGRFGVVGALGLERCS